MLHFDFDDKQITDLAAELGASDKDVKRAMNRAVKRTAGTIRRMSSKGLQTELGLRNATAIRRRIKEYRVGKGRGSVKLWYGVNDLPISAFPGRKRVTGDGVQVGEIRIDGAFLTKIRGKQSAYIRHGRGRWDIREATVPIEDRARVYLEDEVFVEIEAILWKHFSHEIRAILILHVGK